MAQQQLEPGGHGVEVGGVRLQVAGFSGVATELVPALTERGGEGERGGPGRSLGDRLVERLNAAPEAFKVGPPVELSGEQATTRGGSAEAPGRHGDLGRRTGTGAAAAVRGPRRIPQLGAPRQPRCPPRPASTGERGGDRGPAAAEAVFTVALTPSDAGGVAERGISSFVFKKVFRVVSAVLFDPLAAKVGKQAAVWKERSRQPLLRSFGPEDYQEPATAGLSDDELAMLAKGRALLFVHGTNSLSHSGFNRLPKEFLASVWKTYGGRVIAFDHPTLSVSPNDNAAWLGQHLPDGLGLQVDIVAHSRGGLVARELAERATDAGLTGKLQVRSITFVGTPNKGTPLCEPAHLASYVDTLTNLLSVIPDNGITDALDGVVGMVSHLAGKAYEGVPGAMAMNPGGAYLQRLNPGLRPEGCTYRGIASDFEPVAGAGWKLRLRDKVIDTVFRNEKNDLLVPTASVWGDQLVPDGQRWQLGAADAVDHSSYWENPGAVDRMLTWLEASLAAPCFGRPGRRPIASGTCRRRSDGGG